MWETTALKLLTAFFGACSVAIIAVSITGCLPKLWIRIPCPTDQQRIELLRACEYDTETDMLLACPRYEDHYRQVGAMCED